MIINGLTGIGRKLKDALPDAKFASIVGEVVNAVDNMSDYNDQNASMSDFQKRDLLAGLSDAHLSDSGAMVLIDIVAGSVYNCEVGPYEGKAAKVPEGDDIWDYAIYWSEE